MDKLRIDVLGTNYEVITLNKKDKYMIDNNLDGYCDLTSKKIVVCGNENDFDNQDVYTRNIIRHELIHAFLNESGIPINISFHNENMVEWLAGQFPKLMDCFEIVGCE